MLEYNYDEKNKVCYYFLSAGRKNTNGLSITLNSEGKIYKLNPDEEIPYEEIRQGQIDVLLEYFE